MKKRALQQQHCKQPLLYAFTGGILALLLAGFASVDFSLPKTLWGDHTFLLVLAKNLMSHGLLWENSDIGRPGGFSMHAFPFPDMSQHAILWLCTLTTKNPFQASNYYYVLVILCTYWSAFFALWKSFQNILISLFGGILFLFVPYLVIRSHGHDYLTAYYAAPWTYIVCFMMTKQVTTNSPVRELALFLRNWEVLLGILIMSLSGVYYLAFSLMLICIYSFVIAIIDRPRIALKGTVVVLLCLIIFSIAMYPSMHFISTNNLDLPSRFFMEQTLYATKISDLLWTWTQYFSPNQKFIDYMRDRSEREGYDFWPGLPLSIFSLASILFYPLWWKEREDTKSIKAILIFMIFSILYSMPYGLGLLFNALVTPVIRSQARISPFFTFGAILLLAHQLKQTLRDNVKIGCVLFLLTLINGWPYFGFYSLHQNQLIGSSTYQNEEKSIQNVLKAIHSKNLKQIVQLPIEAWPEAPSHHAFMAYNHWLPYIFDTLPSSTSWSYGMMRHAPELAILFNAKNFLPLGFDGILIQKDGYNAQELQAVYATLMTSAQTEYEDSSRHLLSLH